MSWRRPQAEICCLVTPLSRCLLPGPSRGDFSSAFASASASLLPLLALSLFLPSSFPSLVLSFCLSVILLGRKSQRDSLWGVVGYDLRAGCDARHGSQRYVGRGVAGRCAGVAWAWACVRACVRYVTGSGCSSDGRAGRLVSSRRRRKDKRPFVVCGCGQRRRKLSPTAAVMAAAGGSGSSYYY
ncbi:hypothetical protein F5883DRAFT_583114 [Diaporthe sp. PMI_573]|nr:hypothetical protein F5883DRAFT_583114 [Diaporthaceae sp. PMI_573]